MSISFRHVRCKAPIIPIIISLLVITFYIPSSQISYSTAYSQEPTREDKEITIRMHFTAARRLYIEKRYEEALKELQDLLTLDPENHVAFYAMGMVLKDMERFKEAVEAFKKVTELRPGDAEPYAQMGFIMVRVGAYEEGVGSLEKFLSMSPDSPLAEEARKAIEFGKKAVEVQRRFETVAGLIKEEKWEEALKENEILQGLEPDNHRVFYDAGLIYSKLKRNDEAIGSLKKALEREPKYFLAHYQLALVYEEMGQLEETIAAYEGALASTGEESDKEKIRGRIATLRLIMEAPVKAEETKKFLEKGDIQGAIKEAEGYVEGRKMDPRAYLILGGLYIQGEQLEEAASTLEKGVSLDPKNMEIRILLGSVYEKLGRLEKAVTHYRVAATLGKETAEGKKALDKVHELEVRLHFDKAKGLKEAGDLEGALREIEAILTIFPENPVALFNAGVLHDLLERPDQAETFLKKTISIAKDYVQAHLQLALLLERQRRFDEAMDAYNTVLNLQKEGEESDIARERLAEVKDTAEVTERMRKTISLIERRDLDGALKEAQAAISIYPRNYIAYFYLGIIYTQSEKFDEAIAALRKVIEFKPNFLQAYILLGRVLLRQDMRGEAREIYQKVAEIGKGRKEGEQAAILLKRLRPWAGNLSWSHFYNTNVTSGVKPVPTFSSAHGLNWIYLPWITKKGTVRLGASGSQSIYYYSQLRVYGYRLYTEGEYRYDDDTVFSLNLSQRKSYYEQIPDIEAYSLSGNFKITLRTFPTTLTVSYSEQRKTSMGFSLSGSLGIPTQSIPTSLSLGGQFSSNRSYINKASDADQYTLSVNLSQSLGLKNTVTGGYSLSINPNLHPLGNNYGNRTHSISIGFSRTILPEMTANLSYNIGVVQYMNPDSTTLFQRFRRNFDQTFGGGLSVPLSENVSFSVGFNHTKSQTNLPRPTAELQQTLEDILADVIPTVGGGYESHSANISIGVRF